MKYKTKNYYGVYDMKDNERLVALGNIYDLVEFFNKTPKDIYRAISANTKFDNRYFIYKFGKEKATD